MNETTMTLAGNLVADPELLYTPAGVAVVNLRIASTARYKDAGGQWQDGHTLFMNVMAWRSLRAHHHRRRPHTQRSSGSPSQDQQRQLNCALV